MAKTLEKFIFAFIARIFNDSGIVRVFFTYFIFSSIDTFINTTF